jgi:hypothetical protein
MTIDELKAQRAALVAALGGGELRVVIQSAGARREVEFRGVADLERAISAIDREIAANSGTRINTFLPTFSKGL